MDTKPVNKSMANYLRQKLVARSGALSAVAEIANGMSDDELVEMYNRNHALTVAKLVAARA